MDAQQVKRADELVKRAKAWLVIHQPFFSSILLRRHIIYTDNLPTMGVDARAQMYINPSFACSLTKEQMIFGLAHETMHIVCMHAQRKGSRHHMKWNYAGDAFINDTLKSLGIGDFIHGGVDMPGSKDKTTERIYDELPDQKSPGGLGADLVPGEGREPTESEMASIEAQIKIEIAQGAQSARMAGKMPAGFDRFVEEILYVKTPWYDYLERFMTEICANDYSWAHPSRRFIAKNIYLPSVSSQDAMGELVLGIDTSGSIGDRELGYFAGHLNRIMESARPSKVHLVYCDAVVNKTVEVLPDEYPVHLQAVGGGGTNLVKIFDWVETEGIEPACIVILTDCETPFPDSIPAPTIWLSTTKTKAPVHCGETIFFEVDDERG